MGSLLFEPPENVAQTSEKVGDVLRRPQVERRISPGSKNPGRKAQTRSTCDLGTAANPTVAAIKRPKKATVADLVSRRHDLEAELSSVNRQVDEAAATQAQFESKFFAIHSKLVSISAGRMKGEQYQFDEVRKLYDARLVAGCEWSPHRKRYRELQSWQHAVLAELRFINMEIG